MDVAPALCSAIGGGGDMDTRLAPAAALLLAGVQVLDGCELHELLPAALAFKSAARAALLLLEPPPPPPAGVGRGAGAADGAPGAEAWVQGSKAQLAAAALDALRRLHARARLSDRLLEHVLLVAAAGLEAAGGEAATEAAAAAAVEAAEEAEEEEKDEALRQLGLEVISLEGQRRRAARVCRLLRSLPLLSLSQARPGGWGGEGGG